jgi:hypothetical protein
MDLDTVQHNLKHIRSVIEDPVEPRIENINELIDKGVQLVNLAGLAAECEAQARRLMDEAIANEILELTTNEALLKSTTATNVTLIAKGKAARFTGVYEYAIRLNRGISHHVDLLRSVISLYKEEMHKLDITNQINQ